MSRKKRPSPSPSADLRPFDPAIWEQPTPTGLIGYRRWRRGWGGDRNKTYIGLQSAAVPYCWVEGVNEQDSVTLDQGYGFHAFHTVEQAIDHEQGDLVGAVRATGKIMIHQLGFRSEKMEVLGLLRTHVTPVTVPLYDSAEQLVTAAEQQAYTLAQWRAQHAPPPPPLPHPDECGCKACIHSMIKGLLGDHRDLMYSYIQGMLAALPPPVIQDAPQSGIDLKPFCVGVGYWGNPLLLRDIDCCPVPSGSAPIIYDLPSGHSERIMLPRYDYLVRDQPYLEFEVHNVSTVSLRVHIIVQEIPGGFSARLYHEVANPV